jgi:hypothetical protein
VAQALPSTSSGQALLATAGAIPEAGPDWSASQFSTKVLRFAVGELSRAKPALSLSKGVPAPHSLWVSHCDQISAQPTTLNYHPGLEPKCRMRDLVRWPLNGGVFLSYLLRFSRARECRLRWSQVRPGYR